MHMPVHTDPILAAASKSIYPPPNGKPHGVAIPGSQQPGHTAVYRHHLTGSKELPATIDPAITTMYDALVQAARKYPTNKCLGWREQDKKTRKWGPYQWIDYKTVYDRALNLGAGLVQLHSSSGVSARERGVGIWSQNRPEWQLTDLAAGTQSLYTVSIYDSLGAENAVYIINHAEIVTVVSSLLHIPSLLSIKDRCPTLKNIVSMDPLVGDDLPGTSKRAILEAWAKEKGIELYFLGEVEEIGKESGMPPRPVTFEDPITINYTSGTTGFPKGVLLTHRNAIAACTCAFTSSAYQVSTDVLLSYLPLAHIYARIAENTAIWAGAGIGYFHGNMAEVLDDIRTLRPTTFISVPRLFNRIYNAVNAATIEQGGIKGALSRHALSAKMEHMKNAGSSSHPLYDRIWANKIAAAIGFDRCRGMVSGSAPIAPEVLQQLRCVFSNNLIQGWGMTETHAVGIGQLGQDNTAGSCGPPCINAEARLRDVKEMGYTSQDKPYARGELLIRGPFVFTGYYKAPDITAGVFDEGGWFATGDICSIDEMGRFTIIDRVKNLIKLAQGEYVSPEKIENEYLANMPIFSQGIAHGDSFQTYMVGVFGVDRPHFAEFAGKLLKRHIDPMDTAAIEQACAEKTVRVAILKQMDRIAKRNKLHGYERIRNIHLCIDPFTIENELLTPTLKMKRVPAIIQFREILDGLYEEHNHENPDKSKL